MDIQKLWHSNAEIPIKGEIVILNVEIEDVSIPDFLVVYYTDDIDLSIVKKWAYMKDLKSQDIILKKYVG